LSAHLEGAGGVGALKDVVTATAAAARQAWWCGMVNLDGEGRSIPDEAMHGSRCGTVCRWPGGDDGVVTDASRGPGFMGRNREMAED